MAERIVSPGVFTRERDLSFLPAGIAAIGACIIGPTIKGPAFVPTMIRSFPEFEEMFGSTTKDYYTPYAVEQYLRSAGTVTVIRVLNTAGYSEEYISLLLVLPLKQKRHWQYYYHHEVVQVELQICQVVLLLEIGVQQHLL